jgi:hypothetical protein
MARAIDIQEQFQTALDQLIDQVREDRHILAGILCGSLSYDRVWRGSDIDLILICSDDKKTKSHGVSLIEGDVNIHTSIMPRADFKRSLEGTGANSFSHSMIAKGKLLFSNDPSIEGMLRGVLALGARDAQRQLLSSGSNVTWSYNKAQKFFLTRGDLDYTSLFILYSATSLAQIEVGLAGELIDREVIPRAVELNPGFFDIVYTHMLNRKKTRKSVVAALEAIEAYLRAHQMDCFRPIFEYLDSEGEVRSSTDISHHFERHYGIETSVPACEWLADIGVLEKASTPVKLTTRSQLEVPELAFLYIGEPLG